MRVLTSVTKPCLRYFHQYNNPPYPCPRLLSLVRRHNDGVGRALASRTPTQAEKMIASSSLYCRRLPETQIHFGEKDDITPTSQGEMLFNAMKAAGLEGNMELFIYNDRTHHNVETNNSELDALINTFFKQLF